MSLLRKNVREIRRITRTPIYAVVKCDAYGHGAKRTASFLNSDADAFAVATLNEAAELGFSGIFKPILVMADSYSPETANFFAKNPTMRNIVPAISSVESIPHIKGAAFAAIKVNTGMNRLGCSETDAAEIKRELDKCGIKVQSVFSHLYNPSDRLSAARQLRRLNYACDCDELKNVPRHIAASSCVTLGSEFHLDAVRPGIAMYGYSPVTEPVMSVYTGIVYVRDVYQGEYIGYGSCKASRDMRIAAIRAGYGDGYRRREGRERAVSINNVLCPVVGEVCMDLTLVDVSRVRLHGDDRVYLLGGAVTGEMLAGSYGTIVYEVLTGFSRRLKRIYKE